MNENEIKKLIKDLQSLIVEPVEWESICYINTSGIIMYIKGCKPDEDGKVLCPAKDCEFEKIKLCGHRIRSREALSILDESWNNSIERQISEIKRRFKINE